MGCLCSLGVLAHIHRASFFYNVCFDEDLTRSHDHLIIIYCAAYPRVFSCCRRVGRGLSFPRKNELHLGRYLKGKDSEISFIHSRLRLVAGLAGGSRDYAGH